MASTLANNSQKEGLLPTQLSYVHYYKLLNDETLQFTAHYTLNVYYSCKCSFSLQHTHTRYTDIVLNTLNPDRAVEIITPDICGCQWTSLISD